MKILAVATLVASLSMTSAIAGSSPYTDFSPTSSWSGMFVGVTGGAIVGGELGDADLETTGYLGAEAGYQVQNTQFVYGGLFDYGLTKFDSSTDYDMVGLSTLRFKLGVPVLQDSFLVYGTAGVAAAHSWDEDFSGLEFGLAAGVGADYRLSDDTVISAEYVYTSFDDIGGSELSANSLRFKWAYFMPN